MITSHVAIQPKILYYGTPVVLLTTLNEDASTNISPLSSSWALGNTIVLGIGLGGKAMENLERHPQCVLNIPDATMWRQVEALAPLTGKDPVPDYKREIGFRFEKEKFAAAGLSPIPSEKVTPCRIKECPLQIEAEATAIPSRTIPGYLPLWRRKACSYMHTRTSLQMSITSIRRNGTRSFTISVTITVWAVSSGKHSGRDPHLMKMDIAG